MVRRKRLVKRNAKERKGGEGIGMSCALNAIDIPDNLPPSLSALTSHIQEHIPFANQKMEEDNRKEKNKEEERGDIKLFAKRFSNLH